MPNSDKKVWWKCSKGHEWQASISHRSQGRGCPYCSGRKTLKGYNDLQTINPAVAKEWNYEKNNGLMPADVTPNSDIKAWWKCSNGHEWQATIGSRHKGSGCPGSYCRWQEINPNYFTKFAEFTLTIEDAQEYVYSISPTKRVRGWRDIEVKLYI